MWLSRKNISFIHPLGKLDHKKVGLFKIIELIENVAFRLELSSPYLKPPIIKIHNVFYAVLLSTHVDNTFEER